MFLEWKEKAELKGSHSLHHVTIANPLACMGARSPDHRDHEFWRSFH